eukprot:30957-Pelagococcus_subviridis.AAC.39
MAVYRTCLFISAKIDCATLPHNMDMRLIVCVDHTMLPISVPMNVKTATIMSVTLMSMSKNFTVILTSGKTISTSAIGTSWKDLITSGPAPPTAAFWSPSGLSIRYSMTSSLNVGS